MKKKIKIKNKIISFPQFISFRFSIASNHLYFAESIKMLISLIDCKRIELVR